MHSTWINGIGRLAAFGMVGLLLGCGGAEDGEPLEDGVGASQQALAPGSNSQVISNNIPLTMAPGERLDVQAVMRNTGSALDGSNTWTTTGYSLSRTVNTWGWVSTAVPASTPVNSNAAFNFVITAPSTPGTYAFGARMRQDIQFGATLSVPSIVVSPATTPRWSCTYLPGSSNVPTAMAPGENRAVTIVVRNSGTQSWQTAGTYLKSQDAPAGLWGNTVSALTAPVAPNATTSFTFGIKAPTTPGTYHLLRQIQNPNVGVFSAASCVDLTITVGGSPALNSSLIANTLPTVMAPGETRAVTVTLRNTGTQTWLNDGSFKLNSKNAPGSLWGLTVVNVNATTATNANYTFSFGITAPTTPGAYNHRWQMKKLAGADAGDFGVIVDVPVTVDANATAQYTATVVSQNIPARITAGEAATFAIRMQNSGTAAWTGSNFTLYSQNSPATLWSLTNSPLGAAETVAPGATRDFNLSVLAPTSPGLYDSKWRMRQLAGINFFGEEASTTGIEVTLCGNNALDAGEQCDDDNLSNGDGCSDACTIETTQVVDLAATAADRSIVGLQTNKLLANVAFGDFTADGRADVVIGQNTTVQPAGQTFRNQAGQLNAYSGATFFAAGASMLTVYGAEANDSLGAHGTAGVYVADVTGDGVADIVASAGGADGLNNAKSNSGEVFVLEGGPSLTGTIDLATNSSVVKARVLGAAANDSLRVIALGDVNNDAVADLVLGGVNRVYIVPGGASLSGDVDLAAPPPNVLTIAGNGVGSAAAVGDFGGSTAPDLLLGSGDFTHGGLSQAGGAWGFFGPVVGNRDVTAAVGSVTGPDVAWYGATANDHLGVSVEVGDFLGSTRRDVLLAATQQRKAGLQVGAVNVWSGPVASGVTFSLAAGDVPSTTILGSDQYDGLGSSIALGDWNQDGILDLAVAAYAGDGPLNDRDGAGELSVVLGSRSFATTVDLASYAPSFKAYGAGSRDLLGSRNNNVAFGDVDGDGVADLCIGSPKGGTGSGLTAPGRVDCFH
jgi:cysteine-rich repeat protein